MATKPKGTFPDRAHHFNLGLRNNGQFAEPVFFVVALALLIYVALVAAAMMARGAL